MVDLNYTAVGATRVADSKWHQPPTGWRAYERTVSVGRGDSDWERLSDVLMSWGIKTRSGFEVRSERGDLRVQEATNYTLVARFGPISIKEPARVVAVVDASHRRGFAYGTRDGHPVCGEEAFVLSRDDDTVIWLTLRSLTRPGTGKWRYAFPLILIAQRWYRTRYLRALLQ